MSNVAARPNMAVLEEQYDRWKNDPQSVEESWAFVFEGFELGFAQPPAKPGEQPGFDGESKNVSDPISGASAMVLSEADLAARAKLVSLVYAFRSIGHTAAWIDPLADEAPIVPELSLETFGFSEADLATEVASGLFANGRAMPLGEMIESLRSMYCGFTGFEYMHIHNEEVRHWLRERIEGRRMDGNVDANSAKQYLSWLAEASGFEEFLHQKYVGQKRFSLEGGEALMVALQSILNGSPDHGIEELVTGMAHRGRLNVLANFLKKPLQVILYEFSDNYVPQMVGGDGDVKYHLGFETKREAKGKEVSITLAANPSHLEAVNPVVEGKARARQRILNDKPDRKRVVPVLIHGDAAFAGQGPVAEVLNLSQLSGYRTGGTIHLIVNNQIGFTTQPEDARSSDYCTDVAKMIEAPVFHVNGDHPEEVAFATDLALEFRQKFGRDVVIDIVCYRKHGHNEGDEASFTQPVYNKAIKSHPTPARLYRDALVEKSVIDEAEAKEIMNAPLDRLDEEYEELKALQETEKGARPDAFAGSTGVTQAAYSYDVIETGVEKDKLLELGRTMITIPEDFRLHPTIRKRFLPAREKALESGEGFDWAHAEALAFASLMTAKGHGSEGRGYSVRLSGQDSRRGTFSHRHSVFYDTENRDRYIPLMNLGNEQATFYAYNSLLSEAAVLGFDYGYALTAKDVLVCWEAQFGDFANGAQVIIDQFISSAESKWGQPSSIVMLLPHGYEGQGPEHSSARLERFLQLCAEGNLQVANVTTPAQYFHILRRQMVREEVRKPLILMTPKSLLRHPSAVSTLDELSAGTSFREMIDDEHLVDSPKRVTRLIFCSGKVYYDLLEYRDKHELKNAAIIRIEQLYPFHWDMLAEIVARYPRANKKWVWCQEEPLNMGAWSYVSPRLFEANGGHRVRFAGRGRSSSPATGAKAVHVREQRKLVEDAFCV